MDFSVSLSNFDAECLQTSRELTPVNTVHTKLMFTAQELSLRGHRTHSHVGLCIGM